MTSNHEHHKTEQQLVSEKGSSDHNPISIHDAQTLSDSQQDARDHEDAARLMDDLELLRAERLASNQSRQEGATHHAHRARSKSAHRGGRHNPEPPPEDAFDTLTAQPQMPAAALAKPADATPTALRKLFRVLRRFPRAVRYLVYAIPVAVVLLAPILLDVYAFPSSDTPVGGPGGLRLLWFGIWLEVVWCSLWISRVVVATLPFWFGMCAKMVGSSNHKKWKDIGRQMEMSTALFLWMLGLIASFKPITDNHRGHGGTWTDGDPPYITWIDVVWKVIIALFVLAASNWLEKILIQWIATSFHVRTYAARIEQNRLELNFLVQLYEYSKLRLQHDDTFNTAHGGGGGGGGSASGGKTPLRLVQDNARQVLGNIGKVAGKVAGDFTGRKVMAAGHPRKVVLELMRSTHGAHILARRIYRTFVRGGAETIGPEDLRAAFAADEDAEACFGIFDRDLNGDISMEELELVCNEVHLEKKAIAASLKDLDSVVRKLDQVFLFIIFIVAAIVFVSIISGSAASALGTSGTTILGLSWMLQATAQEFLQSIIFVFVKHPFDVGDRVTVYGNTGSLGTGDDYYVQEISLLYTEFKKMEGHIVQAPNSLLNTLFILNQRRSSGLADPIELKLRFGTPAAAIDELKARMLDFVLEHKRDYQPRIISEVRTIDEVYSVTLNLIFFHKSNYQNELLRLQRHNKFAAELMAQMTDLGIEGPRKASPGGNEKFPFYFAHAPSSDSSSTTQQAAAAAPPAPTTAFPLAADNVSLRSQPSNTTTWMPPSPDTRRRRAESRARQMESRLPDFGDVFEGRRDPATANLARLQSLREEAAASSTGDGGVSSHASGVDRVVSGGGGGGPLLRAGTMDSGASRQRRGIFGGRPRSATNRGDARSDAGASIV